MTTLEAGLVPERLEALDQRVQREVDEGLLPSCQFAIAKDGRVLVQKTYGDATDTTRYCMYSATKVLAASAFWILLGDGDVKTTDRVADILPGFGNNGKDAVTVEHVLLHTCGFPNATLGPADWKTHESRVKKYEQWRLDWEPGSRYLYHAMSAHWVLMDILTEITGVDHRTFIKERIIEPIGLKDMALGIRESEQTNLAEVSYVGAEMTPDELEAAFGIREIPAPKGSLASLGDWAIDLNLPEWREAGIPGGGAFSTAADVTLFYQALLHNDAGIWDPETLRLVTSEVRNMLPDWMTKAPASRALGVVIAGDDGLGHMRGFGKTQSPRAFGHNGAGGQIAYVDPETGVSFCYLTNGQDRHTLRTARRTVGIASRAGLVTMI